MFDEAFFDRPAHLINRAARLMTRLGDARLKDIGFSTSQLPVLGSLMREGPLPQKALAERARIEQPSMAQMLSRMERDGLVLRYPDPDDKRSHLISLSDQARMQLPQVFEVLTKGSADALSGFSDEEVASLGTLLKKLIGNLQAIADDGGEKGLGSQGLV